jgi:MYXO-CTERM domain-containing protein
MVFDSKRNKIVLFGGRAGSGFNYADTWEWDPSNGTWTDATSSGSRPSARSQHAMVYEKSTGNILLFGGGRSDSTSSDGTGISVSFGDTWEWNPTARAWTQLKPTASPAARHDFGMVWDSSRNLAVLFGGMEKDTAGVDGSPLQDTWEWDPSAGTWTERTTQGAKPSPRYAHSMAFAGGSNKAIVFGGWDIITGGSKNDLWEWDPVGGSWTLRLAGTEAGIPSPRMYASLVSDDSKAKLELIAGTTEYSYGQGIPGTGGAIGYPPSSAPYGSEGTREVWEINTTSYACQDRSAPTDTPLPRSNHALAYNPSTGKTYVFGGVDMNQQPFDDLWEWDGKTWAEVTTDVRPSARSDAGLAYDPVRNSLILYGGQGIDSTGMYYQTVLGDTWEWSSTTRQWKQLFPTASPDPLYSHGMVTDTTRNKILLFAGMSNYQYYIPMPVPYEDPMRNEVWEWDGNTMTWTNRTPVVSASAPSPRQYPILAYDEGRQKLFVEESSNYSYYGSGNPSAFWEWDPISAGWAYFDTGDYLNYGTPYSAAYDSTRRREVVYGDLWSMTTGIHETWELDAKGPTWYVREIQNSPSSGYGIAMAFDRTRGVVVLFGGNANGYPTDETWEYSVTSLGNGEGCSTSTPLACASGNCVDGVCCASASCTGPCKSCSVSGSEGTCVLATAGTQVPGSCSSGQACDGAGNCKASNGQTCSSASTCASGFCVDGVCCDSACDGTCVSCNQSGLAGTCRPYPAGSDPQKECGQGSGICKAGCDGVGACALPPYGTTCGTCLLCDGMGTCNQPDPYCGYPTGGIPAYGGTYGGYGGYTGTGGTSGRGGITGSTGGTTPSGGVPTDGGYNHGGTYGYGGITSYGGTYGYGGSTHTGGTYGYGGITSYGGTYGYGGTFGYGGSTRTGGTYGYGGTPSTGGTFSTPSGGSTGGSGGASGSGGSSGTGTGSGGSSGNRDGGYPGTGGRINPDAQGQDAIAMAQLHRSGCNCALGSTAPAGPGLATPIFLAGFALLLRRIRRPRR